MNGCGRVRFCQLHQRTAAIMERCRLTRSGRGRSGSGPGQGPGRLRPQVQSEATAQSGGWKQLGEENWVRKRERKKKREKKKEGWLRIGSAAWCGRGKERCRWWDGWMDGLVCLVKEGSKVKVTTTRQGHDKGTNAARPTDRQTDRQMGVGSTRYWCVARGINEVGPGESMRGWECGSGSGNWRLVSF
jgi:hypothetical protein